MDRIYGPSLPPSAQDKDDSAKTFGPALPPHMRKTADVTVPDSPSQSHAPVPSKPVIGPDIPQSLREQLSEDASNFEEDDVFGPLPPGAGSTKAHVALDERALQMKIDQLDPRGDKEPTREEWMVELPPAKAASFGLGPRSFRAKAAPDLSDRSSWTDTPKDKADKKLVSKEESKVDLREEARLKNVRKRDQEQEEAIKKSKRTKESLVDIHAKKMKKDETGPAERKPFSRDTDLQVNRFDEAQKKAVLKKAQLLDDRFSAGESKFL